MILAVYTGNYLLRIGQKWAKDPVWKVAIIRHITALAISEIITQADS